MFLIESVAALAAKVAGASTVAQVAAGLGIAVAGVTGAGAAGVLPGPVQDGVAGAVESVTPFDLPGSADLHRSDSVVERVGPGTEAAEIDDSGVDGTDDQPGVDTEHPDGHQRHDGSDDGQDEDGEDGEHAGGGHDEVEDHDPARDAARASEEAAEQAREAAEEAAEQQREAAEEAAE